MKWIDANVDLPTIVKREINPVDDTNYCVEESNPVLLYKNGKYYCVKYVKWFYENEEPEEYWQQEDVFEVIWIEDDDVWAEFELYE